MPNPKLICLVLFSLTLFKGTTQDNYVDTTVFSVDQLQEDLLFWRNGLEKNHPILYQYNTKESFDHFFDSLYSEIKGPMTRGEFFRLIGPASLFIKCSHAQIMSTSKMSKSIVNSPNMIPIDIRWYSDTAYVSYNYTDNPELAQGTVIHSINGVTLKEMYPKFLSLLPRDGYSMQFPKYWVNRIFYFYYHLWYDMNDFYEVVYFTQNRLEKIKIAGMSSEEMNSVEIERPKTGLEKPEKIQLKILDSISTAYLQIGSFTPSDIKSNNGKSWKNMLDSCFAEITHSKAAYLILDLQENGGGSPEFAWYLCRYFMNEDFEFKSQFRKIKDKDESAFDKRSKKTLFKDKTVGKTKPAKINFKGELFLLIDGGSCSASSEVASVVRRYKRGIIIGEEGGGSPWLISSNWFYFRKHQLPNTKLSYSSPARTYVLGDYKKDTGYGTIPDYTIQPTLNSYLHGEDLALLKAFALISEKAINKN